MHSPVVAIPLLIGAGVALLGWVSTTVGAVCLIVAGLWLLWLIVKVPVVRRYVPVIDRVAAYLDINLDHSTSEDGPPEPPVAGPRTVHQEGGKFYNFGAIRQTNYRDGATDEYLEHAALNPPEDTLPADEPADAKGD